METGNEMEEESYGEMEEESYGKMVKGGRKRGRNYQYNPAFTTTTHVLGRQGRKASLLQFGREKNITRDIGNWHHEQPLEDQDLEDSNIL